jgi:GDP-L-fucose synthase
VPESTFDLAGKRIWVAGHRGMVGSAVVRRLKSEPCEVVVVDREEVDLTRQSDVERWVMRQKLDAVVLCAARVGGIHANATRPAEFLFTNLMIGANIIDAAWHSRIPRLVNLGSSCMYPVAAPQPIAESSLMTGRSEVTNEGYATAKIATANMASAYRKQYGADYITIVPTNLYGPGDNFDPTMSHVAPGLMRRMIEARDKSEPTFHIWGSGTPRRELMFVDDAADAIVFLLQRYSDQSPINVGVGSDVSIRELAEMIARAVDYSGKLAFDASKPDGAPRRLLDSSRLAALGWHSRWALADGLSAMYRWYCSSRLAAAAHAVGSRSLDQSKHATRSGPNRVV